METSKGQESVKQALIALQTENHRNNNLKKDVPIAFSSPRAQPEVVSQPQNFSFKFAEMYLFPVYQFGFSYVFY